jgi:hypothetical protein
MTGPAGIMREMATRDESAAVPVEADAAAAGSTRPRGGLHAWLRAAAVYLEPRLLVVFLSASPAGSRCS